jgi:protoporphyrinogen oxidase
MLYDIIIVGGGISSLYFIHKIKNLNLKILVLEKNDYLGGRIKTFHTKIKKTEYMFEEGAGRFNENHTYLIQLLKELKLSQFIVPISAKLSFVPSKKTYDKKKEYNNQTANTYFQKTIEASKSISKEDLQSQTYQTFANTILTKEEFQFILDSCANYYTILKEMNCYEALKLLSFVVNDHIKYYGFSCGFSKMIETLCKNKTNNIQFKTKSEVTHIKYNSIQKIYTVSYNNKIAKSKILILTTPKPTLLQYKILQPIFPLLRSIKIKSLCRIYSIFNPKDIWFQDIGKISTNNSSRTMIPVNKEKGVIMISYSDGKYADYWNKQKNQSKMVNELLENVNNTLKIKPNKPFFTKKCYWKVATAYWLKNRDSKSISKKIQKPFEDQLLYICGENYSRIQGWIEGALIMVEDMLAQFNKDILQQKIIQKNIKIKIERLK